MRIHRLLSSTVLLLASALSAQQNVAWLRDNQPTGSNNAFPWGSLGIRYQAIAPGSLLPPGFAVVNDLLVAGRPGGADMEIVYDDIEIRMGLTAQATPTSNWTSNNPNPTLVYRGPLRVQFQVGAWRGIGLPVPYNFIPTTAEPNLCIEVIVWSTSSGTSNFYFPCAEASLQRAFLYQWTTSQGGPTIGGSGCKMGLVLNDGNFVDVGHGCRGSGGLLRIGANGWPRGGQPFDVTLAGAARTSPVFLALGASFTKFAGVPLPIDLTLAGAPGCFAWNDPLMLLGGATDASGQAKVTLPIPMTTNFGRVYCTWINLDPGANALGITTSGAGKLILGL